MKKIEWKHDPERNVYELYISNKYMNLFVSKRLIEVLENTQDVSDVIARFIEKDTNLTEKEKERIVKKFVEVTQ